MTADPNSPRPRVRAFFDAPTGAAYLRALEAALEAFEREEQANSDEAREDAEQAALAADATLASTLGTVALRRRRLLRALDALEVGAKVDDADYTRRMKEAVKDASPKGRIRLRHAVARDALDSTGTIGAALANHLAAHLKETASGRRGLMHAEPMQGVDRETAPSFGLRNKTIADCGYTVGQEVLKSRVPPAYWQRAAKVHNVLAARLQAGNEKVVMVSAATVRDWCTRDGDGRELFEKNRADGRRDRAAGKVDEARMLRSKPK